MNRSSKPRVWFQTRRGIDAAWVVVLAVIVFWVAYRLGAFDLWSTVTRADGATVRIPKTFGGIDHPFHATRAELMRRALSRGDLLRWVSAHQGGYPVEFYPLGAPAFELAIWAALLGTLPIMAAHKIAVIVIFLLPAAGFLLLARLDRLSLGVGVLALVFHVSVRGWWWSGGYMELVEWGLISSFLAMTAVLLFLPVSFRAVRTRSIRWATVAGIIAAFAVYTNVRSFLPLAAVAAGTLLSLCWEPDRSVELRGKITLAAVILGTTGLLLGPLLVAILRFQHLYYFVIYERYDSIREYGRASISAVSGPIFILAVIGFLAVFLIKDLVAGRLVAFTLVSHGLMTLLLSGLVIDPHIEQLEATRLMPLQRALTLYLAALGGYALLMGLARVAGGYRSAIVNVGLLAVAVVSLLLYVVIDPTPIGASDRGLVPVPVTGEPFFVDQQEAVELASERAEPGTAILVMGSLLSWHDQFWSMQWSDRPFFFDDWLWYWQRDHFGPYDPTTQHAYSDPARVLTREYFQINAIGAVVVGQRAAEAAATSSLLESISQGSAYSVYLVKNPTPIVTASGAETTSIDIEDQRFTADVSQPSRTFEARRNWFPRWTATVDGRPASITKDEHGFMVITASEPGTHLEVVYGVDGWDWLGRMLLAAGIGTAVAALGRPRQFERLLGVEPPAAGWPGNLTN